VRSAAFLSRALSLAKAFSIQVEIWFSILQGQSLRGASFISVKQLREHIDAFIEAFTNARDVATRQKALIFAGRAEAALNQL
jgi:hypothetical protein